MNELILLAILNIENEDDKIFMADIYINYQRLMKAKAIEYVENDYDAEDIVQIAFVKLIRKVSLLRALECCKLIAYIVSTIETTAVDFIRVRTRNANSMFLSEDDEIIEDIPAPDTPETRTIESYEKEIIHKAIKQLNHKHKTIIECKYFQNMSDKEIAKILNIEPQSVREYLTRARKALQKILEMEYDFNGIK